MKLNDLCIKAIKKYQETKPFGKAPRCVHVPSCSNYGIECYKKFNFFKASFLTINRILFCTPLNKKVYDPVPLNKQEKIIQKEKENEWNKITNVLIDEYNKNKENNIETYINIIYNSSLNEDNTKVEEYLYKLTLLKKLIKEKQLDFNYKESIKIINEYIIDLNKITNINRI